MCSCEIRKYVTKNVVYPKWSSFFGNDLSVGWGSSIDPSAPIHIDRLDSAGDGWWRAAQLVRVHRGDLIMWKKQLLAGGSRII